MKGRNALGVDVRYMTSTIWENCSQLQQFLCHVVIDDWMIPHTATETPNAFQWTGQPPKLPLRCRISPRLIHASWAAHMSQPSPNGIVINTAIFTGLTNQTDW